MQNVKNEYPAGFCTCDYFRTLAAWWTPDRTTVSLPAVWGSQHPGFDGRSAQRHDWYRKRPDCVRSVCQGYQERQSLSTANWLAY